MFLGLVLDQASSKYCSTNCGKGSWPSFRTPLSSLGSLDAIGLSEEVIQEQRKLEKQRIQEEEEGTEARQPAQQFLVGQKELDQLLRKAQIFSEFIQLNIDQVVGNKDASEDGRGEEKSSTSGSKKRKGVGKGGSSQKKQKRLAKNGGGNGESEGAVRAFDTKAAMEAGRREGETEEEQMQREQRELMPLFKGQLRPYQVKGVKWMIALWKNGFNGILADQMGLGKTVQIIALLSHLKHKNINGPFLVLAPLSTLSNWISEFNRWCPALSVVLYHGSRERRAELRASQLAMGRDVPVVVTSYEIAMNDSKFLRQHKWKHMIVDEGQRLKNFECRLLRDLRLFSVENILLLTGTPLQNKLSELWSLLNFIMPRVFTDHRLFDACFNFTAEADSSTERESLQEAAKAEVLAKLHMILKPFMLRRMKQDVEASLPRKKEIVLYAQMTRKQRELEKHLVNKTISQFAMERSGVTKAFTNLLMQLRKNCNHPELLDVDYDGYTSKPIEQLLEECGKMRLLHRLLNHLKDRGHKVLIFSQMTTMLDILEDYMAWQGWPACRIDGSVSQADRQQQIADFNTQPDLFVFLLSTRAGGLGINLASADTVIIYDSDWNPQQDLQAMDRVHRIGQTKPVHVYRLATAHSVECKIMETANRKLRLEDMVITKGNFRLEKDKADDQVVQCAAIEKLFEPETAIEQLAQSADIPEEDLLRLLDRRDLIKEPPSSRTADRESTSLPLVGRGYAVVVTASSSGAMLSAVV